MSNEDFVIGPLGEFGSEINGVTSVIFNLDLDYRGPQVCTQFEVTEYITTLSQVRGKKRSASNFFFFLSTTKRTDFEDSF